MNKLFTMLIVLFFSSVFAQDSTRSVSEFELTVKTHLQAIDNKDYYLFTSTVTDKENFNLIMPNGVHISSRNQFLDFTKAWFAEKTWSMKYTILNLKETSEMGFVLLMVNYSDVDQNNNPYSLVYYLNLIFEKQNNEWKLIHDQNTICYDKK